MNIRALGDTAVLIQLGDSIDAATHERVRSALAALDSARLDGVRDIVPAYASIAIHYDPAVFARSGAQPFAALADQLRDCLLDVRPATEPRSDLVEIPVEYGGAHGPDLGMVAEHTGLEPAEVIRRHADATYTVYMIGFAPGFPYLAGLPAELATPRRATPRTAVPAGSVGIAGAQTGIYPLETPGGWQIIGRTTTRLFRPHADPPSLLRIGDRVRFVVVGGP